MAVVRRRRRRDAHAGPGGPAADRASGSPTRPRPRSTWPAPTRSAGRRAGGCLMITGFEGTPAAVEAKRAAVTARADRARRHAGRRGPGRGVGARAVRRAVPPRLDARRRRARRDARDGDVLVQPRGAVRRGEGGARGVARRAARWCSATSRTSTRPAARSTSPSREGGRATRSRSWQAPRPPRATRSSPPARPSPTTTPSAPTTSRGWPHEIGELGVSVLRAVKADLDPTGVLNPGVLVP